MDQYDFSDPNYDFGGRSAILARRLREASAQANAELGPEKGQMVGGFYVAPNPGQYFNAAMQKVLGARDLARAEAEQEALNKEQLRRYEDISKQLATPGSKTVLKRTLGEDLSAGPSMQETSEQVPLDYSNPEDLAADNARRMGLAMQLSKLNLPMAQKVAQDYLAKGAAFPDTLATLQMRQIEAGNQAAQRAQEKERADQLYRLTAAQQADLRQQQIAATREAGQARIDAGKQKVSDANEAKANAIVTQNEGLNASLDRLEQSANQVLNHPGLSGITGVSGKFWDYPGSDAANARQLLETVKTQVAFGTLQDMRNASRTGGALGNVSDKEQAMLKAALAPLEGSISEEQARASLKTIIDYVQGAKGRLQAAADREIARLRGGQSGGSQSGGETRTYKGVTYRKKPGTSGDYQADWEPVQ